MKFRFTINELQNEKHPDYMSDLKLIRALIVERQSAVANVYAPLNERLKKLYNKVSKGVDNNCNITLN